MRAYQEAFIRLFYPAECFACRQMLALEEIHLCSDCAYEMNHLAWNFEDALVDEHFESLDHVWTVFAYDSPLKELLHAVKYARRGYLLKACAKPVIALAEAITSDFRYDAILPIPIDRIKLISRHFNQAEYLARIISPWITPPVQESILAKRYSVPSQTSLTQQEREINVYGAFKIRNPKKVMGHFFLLVDDVFTTGATANEAARILKYHGARRVDLLALAKTVPATDKNNLRLHPHADKIVAS